MSFLLRWIAFFGVALLLCFASVGPLYSQVAEPNPGNNPTMFDEYGMVGGCDHSARLDNFAIVLQNQPDSTGHIVYYGPKEPGEATLDVIKDYLVNSRGIAEDRFQTIYGGPNDDLKQPRIQLWVSPPGVFPPPLQKYENNLDSFTGLYDEGIRWDGVPWGEADGGTGPPVSGVGFVSFLQMLTKRKDTVAYIVAYNGREAGPGAWKRVADQEVSYWQGEGIERNRLKVIYGGADKETKIQLWILPHDQPAPVMDAAPEPPPEKAVQLNSLFDLQLAEERSERWAFHSMLDVLRTNDKLRAVLIVRAAGPEPLEEPDTVPEIEPINIAETVIDDPAYYLPPEPETPPADVLQLAQKWKSELLDKHKIKHDRIVVLFGKPREHEGSVVETWIVPAGAVLPDPDAEPVEETEEAEDGGKKETPGHLDD